MRALATIGRLLSLVSFAPSASVPAVRSSGYESATQGRRAQGWHAPTVGPNAENLPHIRTLRDRSRKAYRDDPYGGGVIDILVSQLVGCGIWPRSLAPDLVFRDAVQKLFMRWSRECDADGRLDYAGLMSQAVRCWLTAGEVFVRFRPRLVSDGYAVPLQLQVLEPELCPSDYHTYTEGNGARVRAGIEFDLVGKRRAYLFYRAHPQDGETRLDLTTLVRIPADAVIHMYSPDRAGQIRGVPALHRVLLTLRDIDVGDDAALLRWQLGNMFMGAIKRPVSSPDASVDPITGQAIQGDQNDQPMIAMEPGVMHDLLPGEELEFNDPPEAGQTYEAFMRQQLRKVAAGARVPYHMLTGDMAQVNDRTIRVTLTDFRRDLEAKQWQVIVHQFGWPIWVKFFERAIQTGALNPPAAYGSDPAVWMDVEWAPDRWAYIHPVQDVEADREEIRSGLASRTQKVKARGYDIEDIDQERATDNDRERRLGLKSDSDASQTDRSGKSASTEVEPAPLEAQGA